MDEVDAAQAAELVRALRDQLHQMTHRLAWVESRDESHAQRIRLEAAALRRDIYEARRHIDRLERQYLNSNGHRQLSTPAITDHDIPTRRR